MSEFKDYESDPQGPYESNPHVYDALDQPAITAPGEELLDDAGQPLDLYGAQQGVTQEFLRITKEVPQVPFGSVAVGRLALAPEVSATFPWRHFLRQPLEETLLQRTVDVTNAIHVRLGIPEDPDLHNDMQFAWELTRSVLGTSLPADERLDQISPVTHAMAVHSSAFLTDLGVRDFARHALGEAEGLLQVPELAKGIGAYQAAILGVSEEFRGNPDVGARLAAMAPHRQSVTDLMRGPLIERFSGLQADAPRGMDMPTVAHNLTRWEPSPDLVRRYFPST